MSCTINDFLSVSQSSLIDRTDSWGISRANRSPQQRVPSLLEFSARKVITHKLQWENQQIPKDLKSELIFWYISLKMKK